METNECIFLCTLKTNNAFRTIIRHRQRLQFWTFSICCKSIGFCQIKNELFVFCICLQEMKKTRVVQQQGTRQLWNVSELFSILRCNLQLPIYKTHNTHNLHSCTVAYFCKIGTYCWVQKCSYSIFRALEPLIYLYLCFFFKANLYSNVNLYLNVVRSAEFHCLNVAPALKMPSLPSHSSSQLCLPPSLTVFVFLYFFNFDQRQLYLLPSRTVFAFMYSCISYFFAALPIP